MKKAFTLMELMIVVTVMGIVAAFAVPNYQKATRRASLRAALLDLSMINAAQEVYKSKYGDYYLFIGASNQGLPSINANLGLNIQQRGGDYYLCHPQGGDYECFIFGSGWSLTMRAGAFEPGVNPTCSPASICQGIN